MMLAPDDLSPGVFVAIHSAKCLGDEPLEAPVPFGVPLRVLGVALPFVTVGVVRPKRAADGGPAILDVRAVRLMKLPQEYVESIRAFGAPEDVQPVGPETESASNVPGAEANSPGRGGDQAETSG